MDINTKEQMYASVEEQKKRLEAQTIVLIALIARLGGEVTIKRSSFKADFKKVYPNGIRIHTKVSDDEDEITISLAERPATSNIVSATGEPLS